MLITATKIIFWVCRVPFKFLFCFVFSINFPIATVYGELRISSCTFMKTYIHIQFYVF